MWTEDKKEIIKSLDTARCPQCGNMSYDLTNGICPICVSYSDIMEACPYCEEEISMCICSTTPPHGRPKNFVGNLTGEEDWEKKFYHYNPK